MCDTKEKKKAIFLENSYTRGEMLEQFPWFYYAKHKSCEGTNILIQRCFGWKQNYHFKVGTSETPEISDTR